MFWSLFKFRWHETLEFALIGFGNEQGDLFYSARQNNRKKVRLWLWKNEGELTGM